MPNRMSAATRGSPSPTIPTQAANSTLDNDEDNFEPAKIDIFGPFFWFDIGRPDFIGVYKGRNGSNWAVEYV